MKIAVSTSDGRTICGHLGRCSQFFIYEADGFEIVNRRIISTAVACSLHSDSGCGHHDLGKFSGCQAVITQGMGQGMYDGLVDAGIMPVLTSETDPEVAVRQFLCGGMTGSYQGNSSCGRH